MEDAALLYVTCGSGEEAKAIARVSHPAIVTLHDFGVDPDGQAYMVQELVRGKTMARTLKSRELGFGETQSPVTAVQLSRGKAESTMLFELSLVMQDLGRLASDLLLYYTKEYSYIDLPTAVTTGSSIMPQKRNPDVLELVRGAAATVLACLNECMMITAKLPSGFQRDLQRVKPPLFRAIDLTTDSLDIMAHLVSGMTFKPDQIRMSDELYATERAYELVAKEGIPFREAYRRIAKRYADS